MNKEKIDNIKRMISLINHKENRKIKINEVIEKVVKSGILNEVDDFGIEGFGFEELEKEKNFDVNVGADKKYYAETSVSDEPPKANNTIFSIPFRCWILGTPYGQIGLKINKYNSKNPDNAIEFDEEKFKKTQKASLGLLGDAIKMNELNKYSLEFYARVASKQLNPKEEEFDKITNAFSSSDAISFADNMLKKWINTVVIPQVRKLTKSTFKDEVDLRIFNKGKEVGEQILNNIIKGISKIKFDAKKANFNALAVEIIKNSVKNSFIKYGKPQIIDTEDFYTTIQNLRFPYNLKTTAQYSSVLNSAYTKKLEKENLTKFTPEDWKIIKAETNSSFTGVPKIDVSDKRVYLTFTYSNAEDLISDLISANEKSLSNKEESRSYSPVYYKNILDKELKGSVFKSLFSPSGKDIDAMMGAVELKPKESNQDEYDDEMEYDSEREKEFPEEFEIPGVEGEISRDSIAKLLKSDKFIEEFNPYARAYAYNSLFPVLNKINKPEFNSLFEKYPQTKEIYKDLIGELLYESLIEIPDAAGLKNSYFNKIESILTKLDETLDKEDFLQAKKLFDFNEINFAGFNRFKTILTKDMNKKSKIKLFSDLLSESKRKKKLAKILKEFSFIINENTSIEVDNLIGDLTQSNFFSKKFNNLSDKHKKLFIEKTVDLLSGKIKRTEKFNTNFEPNRLILTLLIYVLTNSSITNESFKNSAISSLMSILYNNVQLLKFIAKKGTQRSKTPIDYDDKDYDFKYEDIVLDTISKKIPEIKNSNSFNPSKSQGLTWILNVLINSFADFFTSKEGQKILSTKSIDAPKPSTGKSMELGDEEENKFQWFQKDDTGLVTTSNTEEDEDLIGGTTSLESETSKGLTKILQNISSKFGFGLKQFIKNKFSNTKTFSYKKGINKFEILKNNKPISEQDFAIYMLEFMSGSGDPDYYSEKGNMPKYNKFIDFLVKDKKMELLNTTTGNKVELDDKEDNDETSVRPNRVFMFRKKDEIQELIINRIKEAKNKGTMYENFKTKIKPIIKKYFAIQESKKKEIDLEEERIANPDGREKVNSLENFIGSQVFGEDIGGIGEESGWKDGMYGVFSYGLQFPIYLYTNQEFEDQDGNKKNKDGKFRWFHNLEDYKFDIDEDGEKEIMKSVEKHKKVLKPNGQTHGLTRATLLDLIKRFMSKNKIQKLSHTSIEPGGGLHLHYGSKKDK